MPCTNLNDAFELGMLHETKRFHAIFHFIRSIRFGFVFSLFAIYSKHCVYESKDFSFYFDSILFIFVMKWQFTFNIQHYKSRWARRRERKEGRMKNYTHFESVGMSIFQWWFCIDHFSSNIFVGNKSTDYWSKCDLHCTTSCQHSNGDGANANKHAHGKKCNDVLWIENFFVLIFISFSFPLAPLIIFGSFPFSRKKDQNSFSVIILRLWHFFAPQKMFCCVCVWVWECCF